jgi:hypothetical protein
MTDPTNLNDRPKATPKRIEPLKRDGSTPTSPAAESVAAPASVRPDERAARKATDAEIEAHIEDFGPGFVRKPFAERQARLSAPQRPGFHRHWFNDQPGRIVEMQERGYKIVTADGKPIKRTVGISARGDGETGILMEIPIQWWLDDMRQQQRSADETEATIRRNEVAAGDGSNRYIPRDGITVQVERRGSALAPLVSE